MLLRSNDYVCAVVVDVQPEYENVFSFDVGDLLHAANEYDKVLFLYNGADTLGMVSEDDLRHYYLKKLDYDEEAYNNLMSGAIFFDKGYGFFRDIMDSSACFDRPSIVKIVGYMIDNNVSDIRDLNEDDVEIIPTSSDALVQSIKKRSSTVTEKSEASVVAEKTEITKGLRDLLKSQRQTFDNSQ